MYILIVSLILVIAVLMVLVILAQNPKGGLGSQFGGSGGAQVMGVKRTSDLLEKLTWGFAISILILSLSVKTLQPSMDEGVVNSSNIERAQEKTIMPGFGSDLPAADNNDQSSDNEQSSDLEDLTMPEEEN